MGKGRCYKLVHLHLHGEDSAVEGGKVVMTLTAKLTHLYCVFQKLFYKHVISSRPPQVGCVRLRHNA